MDSLIAQKKENAMLKELFTAAMGMMPQQTRLEVIANNLANANTIGFKRASVFERNLIDARANFYNVPGDVEQNDPPVGSYMDYSQGAYQKTGNPLDLAIENQKGFFVVEDVNGNQFFTRAGNFKLSEDGTIETMDGKKLLGAGNEQITLRSEMVFDELTAESAKSLNLRISDNGEVFVNEKLVSQIQVAEIENLETLMQISSGNFITSGDSIINYLAPEEMKLSQGWLENSNVNVINEMIAMIELQRLYELGSKVIQTNDGTLDQSIRIGRFM